MGSQMSDLTPNRPESLLPGKFDKADLERLQVIPGVKVVDIYDHQLEELYKISRESLEKLAPIDEFKTRHGTGEMAGAWVYFPWKNILLHSVGPTELFALRTNRNKLLITEEEQSKLSQAVVGVAGMSVGAGIAVALAYSGISRRIKISDFDELDTSNLNRLHQTVLSVGEAKVALAAQHIYELDPFLTVEEYSQGIGDDNIDHFFEQPKISVVVDEIDDFQMKIKLRLSAKRARAPLLMFTSLGDNILIDVERYDKDPQPEIFNGVLGNLTSEILENQEITQEDARRYAVQLVGQEYVPTKALTSLLEIGKTLVGRPQLYSTIAVDGGLSAFVIRRILLSDDIKSGRYYVNFSKLFNISDDLAETPERENVLTQLLNKTKK